MQIIKREDIPEKRQVRLTIAVDRDTWQASLARCYQGVKSVCPVSGEPTRENIEKQYGAEFLYQEAVNDTYPAALVEAIGQSDIQIAGTPTLTVEEIGADGYTFAAVIDLYPEVQLGQYKGSVRRVPGGGAHQRRYRGGAGGIRPRQSPRGAS